MVEPLLVEAGHVEVGKDWVEDVRVHPLHKQLGYVGVEELPQQLRKFQVQQCAVPTVDVEGQLRPRRHLRHRDVDGECLLLGSLNFPAWAEEEEDKRYAGPHSNPNRKLPG